MCSVFCTCLNNMPGPISQVTELPETISEEPSPHEVSSAHTLAVSGSSVLSIAALHAVV